MSNIKKKLSIILIIFFFLIESGAAIKDSLFATVGNKAITHSDIIEEIKIILILSDQSFEEKRREQLQTSAIQSTVKRKIKLIEIEKYNFSEFNKTDLKKELNQLAANLNMDLETLKNIFETNKIDFANIEKRIKTELLWNGLIFLIYKDRISVNINEIEEQIELFENQKELEEYLVSEIIIQSVQSKKIESKIKEVRDRIQTEGFENAARDLSISESAIRGGDLGWLSENVISNEFKSEIINTPIGNISEPVFLPEGILFFKVRDKRKSEKTINQEDLKNQLINAEKTKILQMHSLSHFENIKRAVTVNYYE